MRKLLLSSVVFLGSVTPVLAAPFSIISGTETGGQSVSGTDTGTVGTGAELITSGDAIQWSGPSSEPGVVITNDGTIRSTGARGIDTSGNNTTRNITFINNAGALFRGDDDAFRIDSDVENSTVTVNNAGTIRSDEGQALDFKSVESGTATIKINNSGTIQADEDDAIRPGSGNISITNSGLVDATNSDSRAINIDHGGSLENVTNFSLTNEVGGTIQSQADAVRITADTGLDTTTGNYTIDNAGTIRATQGGQAIDFNDLESSAANVSITNRSTGVIEAGEADAVRPGTGATVRNAGIICVGEVSGGGCSGGIPDESNDGVDWQGHSGTLINETGGLISGQRHGTTSDTHVNVLNEAGAQIIGRNGSGVGSDGDGTVVNRGTITGAVNGIAPDGDGDGVDIDFLADVTNYGTIEGTGAAGSKDGQPNSAQGLAIGGGTVDNKAGAIIFGQDDGVLVDDSDGGEAYYATTFGNAGRIEGRDGYGVRFVGSRNDTVVNSGEIIGVVAALDTGGGDDEVTLKDGSDITGLVDGGEGEDRLIIDGDILLGEVMNVEELIIETGRQLTLSFDLHIDKLIGATIDGDGVTNIIGNGYNIFYSAMDPANAYLAGRNFQLADGGFLRSVPEPGTLALLLPALLGTAALRRRT